MVPALPRRSTQRVLSTSKCDGFEECISWHPAQLALLCNATSPCSIEKTRLNIGVGVSVIMRHVVLGPNEFSLAAGGLMIVNGNATAEHLLFSNGTTAGSPRGFGGIPAGAVYVMPTAISRAMIARSMAAHPWSSAEQYQTTWAPPFAPARFEAICELQSTAGQACYCETDQPARPIRAARVRVCDGSGRGMHQGPPIGTVNTATISNIEPLMSSWAMASSAAHQGVEESPVYGDRLRATARIVSLEHSS